MWAGSPECHLESHNITKMLSPCKMRTAGLCRAADSQGCIQPVPWKLKLGRTIIRQMGAWDHVLGTEAARLCSHCRLSVGMPLLIFAPCGYFLLCDLLLLSPSSIFPLISLTPTRSPQIHLPLIPPGKGCSQFYLTTSFKSQGLHSKS